MVPSKPIDALELPAGNAAAPAEQRQGGHADMVWQWVGSAILAAAVWSVYGRALDAPFIYDDRDAITENASITHLWPLVGEAPGGPLNPPQFLPTSGRPLVNLTFALNYHVGQLNPAGYRGFNLVLHVLTAMLLMAVVRRTLRLDYFGGRFDAVATPLSFAVAIVWAVHPLQTETVVYVSQRTELLVGFFYLAVLYSSLRYWAAASRRARAGWVGAAVVACLIGMASKEVMATAPLSVLLFERTFIAGSFRRALTRSGPLYVGLAWSWALLVALVSTGPRSAAVGFSLGVTAHQWWLTQAKVLWMYLKLAVWPWPLSIHYQMSYLTLAEAWPWLLATAVLVAAVLVLVWRRSSVGYIGAWVLVILSPTLLVPIATEVAAERRMYLPLAALATLFVVGGYVQVDRLLTLSAGGAKASRRLALPVVAGAALVVAFACGIASAARLTTYQDELSLWRDVLAHNPDDSMALYDIGILLAVRNELPEAIENFQHALRLEPDNAKAHLNLGNALVTLGRTQEAIDHYREALRIRPDYPDAMNNLANVLAQGGDADSALAHFEEAVRINPNNPEAHVNLGVALMKAGRTADAVARFQQALKLQPNNGEAESNLTNALLASGRSKEAVDRGREAVRLIPDSAEAHNNLGAALGRTGAFSEAVDEFEVAVKLKPDFAQAYGNLMATYAELERPAEAIAAAEHALVAANSTGRAALAAQVSAWLAQYRAMHPEVSNASPTDPTSPNQK